MKIQKNDGELSFGALDDIRIKRNSTTGNLDISGSCNLIFDVSGVGFKTLTPSCLLDISGTLNATALQINGVNPKVYLTSANWEIINISGTTYKALALIGAYTGDKKYEWACGYEPEITWYGFSFSQDDDTNTPTNSYNIRIIKNGNATAVATLTFGSVAERDSVYKDFTPFTSVKGDRLKIELQDVDGSATGEECNIILFGYYELF